jgi:hypothetical protein
MKNTRLQKLMPCGVPRYVRCYDNGGESADRYTVCFTGRAGSQDGEYSYRAMSESPFHPQGIGVWGSSKGNHCDVNKWGFAPALGRKCHLGRRIQFADLPEDCRKLVIREYREIWGLSSKKEK